MLRLVPRAVVWRGFLAVLLATAVAGSSAACVAARSAPGAPRLRLETAAGVLTIRLDPEAAPRAVAALVRLARGPLFRDDALPGGGSAGSIGYFDGLAFDYTRPELELRTAVRAPAELFQLPVEIDPHALGLDRQTVGDPVEAMRVVQEELVPAHSRTKKAGGATPQLSAWMDSWLSGHSPDFLIGRSRMEIDAALGWRHTRGLASKPVVLGAVFLVSESPEVAAIRLGIALADLPRRTGRETVVGRVEEGLDVARAIAAEPLLYPASRTYRPRNPVVIQSAAVEDDG